MSGFRFWPKLCVPTRRRPLRALLAKVPWQRYHLSTTSIKTRAHRRGRRGMAGCGVESHDSGGDGRGRSKETCVKWSWKWTWPRVAGGFTAASTLGLSLGQHARSQSLRIRLVLSGPTPSEGAANSLYQPPTPGAVAACSAQSQATTPCSTLLERLSLVCAACACLLYRGATSPGVNGDEQSVASTPRCERLALGIPALLASTCMQGTTAPSMRTSSMCARR